MVFLIFSTLALFAGIYSISNAKNSMLFFFIIIAFVPTGNSYADIISKQGVYFFDFYLLGFFVAFILKSLSNNSARLSIPVVILIGIIVYFSYIIVGGLSDSSINKYFLKDLRPLIMIFAAFLYINTAFYFDGIRKKTLLKILTLMFVGNILDLIWPRLGVAVYKDEYYEDNSYRYLDAATYTAALYIIYYSLTKSIKVYEKKWSKLCLYSAIVCVLIGNSRFMILSIIVSVVIFQIKNLKKFVFYFIIACSAVTGFVIISNYIGAERIVNSLSINGVMLQIATRFSPAISLIKEMSGVQYIFGYGAGTTFDIPWFSYRGLESENVTVDSWYLTAYVKYGIFAILFTYVINKVLVFRLDSMYRKPIILFILMMYFVSAVPYHPYALGLIVGAIAILLLEKNNRHYDDSISWKSYARYK